ncbi:unnamed protein product [Polarella glacialis]|uniref:Uncharacterized protein n=1 Tax=Polarella glacialis TaxID=89957 RepID=A0A813LL45_POLGL|nr:unnamed protein product [Polarella glacialis]
MAVEHLYHKAIEDRDVQWIVAEMRRDAGMSEPIQQWGCDALFRVVQHNPPAAKEIVSCGGIEVVAAAMNRHPGSVEVQNEACTAIWRVVREGGFPAAKAVVEQGGLVALNLVLKTHPDGSAPNEAAMLALGCLADHGLVSFGKSRQEEALEQIQSKGKAFAQVFVVAESGA